MLLLYYSQFRIWKIWPIVNLFLDALPPAPNIPNQFVDSTAEQLFDPVIPINILEIENSNGYSITSTFILNPINSNSAMLILVTFLNQSTFNFLDSLSSVPNFLSFGGFTTEQFFHLKISIDFPETNFHEITIFHYSWIQNNTVLQMKILTSQIRQFHKMNYHLYLACQLIMGSEKYTNSIHKKAIKIFFPEYIYTFFSSYIHFSCKI